MGLPTYIEASDSDMPLTLQWRGDRDYVAAGTHAWDEWLVLARRIVAFDE